MCAINFKCFCMKLIFCRGKFFSTLGFTFEYWIKWITCCSQKGAKSGSDYEIHWTVLPFQLDVDYATRTNDSMFLSIIEHSTLLQKFIVPSITRTRRRRWKLESGILTDLSSQIQNTRPAVIYVRLKLKHWQNCALKNLS